jgi:hypothetical protein
MAAPEHFGGTKDRGLRRSAAPFPQPILHLNPQAKVSSSCVCYFLRNHIVNPAEKEPVKSARKSCAKHVEKTLIFCGFALERLSKTLRITCVELAE